MADLLSQDEIDALLHGVDNVAADAEVAEAAADKPIEPYDLVSGLHRVQGWTADVDLINERIQSNLASRLLQLLQQRVEVKKHPVALSRFGEFKKTLYVPTSINIFSLKGISSKAAIVLDAKLVYSIVNSYFGGSNNARKAQIVGRDFTKTELRVINLILNAVIDAIKESWKQLEPVDFLLLESEMNPVATNAYVSTDMLMISTFRIDLRGEGGEAQLLMPGAMIESIFHQQPDASELESDHSIMRRRAMNFQTVLSGEISGGSISLGELLQLSVGTILPIHSPDRIDVKVSGVSKYKAAMGESHGKLGLRIIEHHFEN